jgi:pimeloyl-[acyl-carrier protein] methyl ester esterase
MSHLVWEKQIAHFSGDWRVIAPDLPGHGGSSWKALDLDGLARDLRFLVESLPLQRITVVGSSFGGLIGLNLLMYCPWHVHRMVFVGALPRFSRTPTYPAGLDVPRIRKLSRQFEGDYASILEIFFRSLFSKSDRLSETFADVRAYRERETLPKREALQRFLDILETEDRRDLLVNIVCPTAFINGTEDYICPVEVVEWIRPHLPYARMEYMKGAGHLPFLSRPAEFNKILEEFLAS